MDVALMLMCHLCSILQYGKAVLKVMTQDYFCFNVEPPTDQELCHNNSSSVTTVLLHSEQTLADSCSCVRSVWPKPLLVASLSGSIVLSQTIPLKGVW